MKYADFSLQMAYKLAAGKMIISTLQVMGGLLL